MLYKTVEFSDSILRKQSQQWNEDHLDDLLNKAMVCEDKYTKLLLFFFMHSTEVTEYNKFC